MDDVGETAFEDAESPSSGLAGGDVFGNLPIVTRRTYRRAMLELLDPDAARARGGLKWSMYGPGVLAAWVAEMDFGLAEPIAVALEDAVRRGDTGYPYPGLVRRTATAAAGFFDRFLGWDVDPDGIEPVPGVVEGIRRAIGVLTEPGTPVAIHTPAYFPFFTVAGRAGRDLIEIPCAPDREGRHTIDLEGVERAFSRGAGSLILCNPWNPTGRALTRSEVAAVVEIARSHGGRIIADEIHAPLAYGGHRHVPAAEIDPEVVVTLTSASKAWDIPGLACAQIVLTSDCDVTRWAEAFTPDMVGVSTFGLIANHAAYEQGGPWLDAARAQLEVNRRVLAESVAEHLPRVGFRAPEATYLAWLDFGPLGVDDPAAVLLENAGVALSPGRQFGGGSERHARLNFASAAETIVEIVERIADHLR